METRDKNPLVLMLPSADDVSAQSEIGCIVAILYEALSLPADDFMELVEAAREAATIKLKPRDVVSLGWTEDAR